MPEDTKYIINESQLTAIGSAIRSKLGEQTLYTVDQMPTKIGDISGGAEVVNVYFSSEEQTTIAGLYTPYKDVNLTEAYTNAEELLTTIFKKDVRVYNCYDGEEYGQFYPLKIGEVDTPSIRGVGIVVWAADNIARGYWLIGFELVE